MAFTFSRYFNSSKNCALKVCKKTLKDEKRLRKSVVASLRQAITQINSKSQFDKDLKRI